MKRTKQISVSLENKPGRLGRYFQFYNHERRHQGLGGTTPTPRLCRNNHYAEDRLDNEEQGRYCKRTLRTTERNDPDAKTYVVLFC